MCQKRPPHAERTPPLNGDPVWVVGRPHGYEQTAVLQPRYMSTRKRGHGEQAAVPLRSPGLGKVPVRTGHPGHPGRAWSSVAPAGSCAGSSHSAGQRLRERGEALTHPSRPAFTPPPPDLRGSARVCWARIRSPLGPSQRHRVTTRRRPVPADRCHRPTNHWSHREGRRGLEGLIPLQGGCERRPGSPRLRVGPGMGGKGVRAVRSLQDEPPWRH